MIPPFNMIRFVGLDTCDHGHQQNRAVIDKALFIALPLPPFRLVWLYYIAIVRDTLEGGDKSACTLSSGWKFTEYHQIPAVMVISRIEQLTIRTVHRTSVTSFPFGAALLYRNCERLP